MPAVASLSFCRSVGLLARISRVASRVHAAAQKPAQALIASHIDRPVPLSCTKGDMQGTCGMNALPPATCNRLPQLNRPYAHPGACYCLWEQAIHVSESVT